MATACSYVNPRGSGAEDWFQRRRRELDLHLGLCSGCGDDQRIRIAGETDFADGVPWSVLDGVGIGLGVPLFPTRRRFGHNLLTVLQRKMIAVYDEFVFAGANLGLSNLGFVVKVDSPVDLLGEGGYDEGRGDEPRRNPQKPSCSHLSALFSVAPTV